MVMVVVMLKDRWKKQLTGFVCSINRINNELASTLVEKCFFDMKDKTSHEVVVKWNEFIELLKIEHDELQKDSQRGSDHTFTNFEGSSGPCLAKKKKNTIGEERENPNNTSCRERR
jgi:hypothetical protein